MAYVVTEPCVQCKHTNCAAVCPVDAFREGPNFLVIDPFECIDCDACVAECPEEAIYPDDEVPLEWEGYIDLNEQLSEAWADHIINQEKDPLPEVDAWSDRDNKRDALIKSWDDAVAVD
ncbi:ferredoxin family protein [Fodinibius saliphilus]|uniref:ferredoxin family protein n=1 Tax=Fodinibius saliphilus TaxID=1920650 RepID=UPI0011098A3B|nr:4Fe-4S dicluster domain-containing protein [Fodinibius saliphilus]